MTKPCTPADMPLHFKQVSHSLWDRGRIGSDGNFGALGEAHNYNIMNETLTLELMLGILLVM